MTSDPVPIVVGVDSSPSSLRALDWAAREAAVRHCPLRIVHAFRWPLTNELMGPPAVGPPDVGLQHAAETVLSAAADRVRALTPDVHIRTDLPADTPAAALIEASHDAALLVVGHRGLGGFTGLVGSVGVQTAAHAACPVIIVRDSRPDEARGHVVVGVDGSGLSGLAIDFAFAHAALHRLGVLAVNVHQMPTFAAPSDAWLVANDVEGWREDQIRLLDEALAGCRENYPDVPVRQVVRHGQPAAVLVAESAGAALTVVGSRSRGGLTGLLLGSTSQTVLQHASGPVAVVRARRRRHDGAATPPPPGVEKTDAEADAPQVSSFAKSLFTGRLPAEMVMPYPRLGRGEQCRVDALIGNAREFLDATYDPVKVEQQRWVGDDIVRGLGERGLLGLYVSPEYGGQGLSQTGYCRVMEEFGGYDGSLSVVMACTSRSG
jgi:nucleotide-binding universal stress UspA family protein